MNTNLNTENYNYDYSDNNIPLNIPFKIKENSTRLNRNHSYDYKIHNKPRFESVQIYNDNIILSKNHNNNNYSNDYRMSNLEERISSLEKMLRYFDEFINLKEEEKKDNQNNTLVKPLIKKINLLEKDIQSLEKEKEENKKIIHELNDKIINLEKKVDKFSYNYNSIQDIINSLSDKEKKLNLLVSDFSDIGKEINEMINNKINEKMNEYNIYNENRINEFLVLVHDINQIIEKNEIKLNKYYENVEKVQADNLNIIKFISVQEQKFNSLDLIMNEFNNMKEKFYLINNNFNNNLIENLDIDLLK